MTCPCQTLRIRKLDATISGGEFTDDDIGRCTVHNAVIQKTHELTDPKLCVKRSDTVTLEVQGLHFIRSKIPIGISHDDEL